MWGMKNPQFARSLVRNRGWGELWLPTGDVKEVLLSVL